MVSARFTIESIASLTDTYLTHADYDAQGRLTEQVFSGEQLIKQYQYTPWAGGSAGSGGKLSQVLAGARGSLNLQNLSYTYDGNGNILTITDAMQTSTFTYDELDRLTSAQAVGGGLGEYPLETYQYDALGRLWNKAGLEMTYNDAEHIHAVTSTSTGSNFVYDAAGNMTTRDGQTLTYTPEGKVASVSESEYTTTTYIFDGDGNRVLRLLNGLPGVPTVYIGNYYEWEDDYVERNYIYAGSQRIAQKINGIKLRYFLGDHLGSTSVVVDASGNVFSEAKYKPFGEKRFQSVTQLPTDFQFTGQRWEESTGLYDYVARMYDPITGHFISADTVFDGWDRYAYTRNNPIRYTDPSGHNICDGPLASSFEECREQKPGSGGTSGGKAPNVDPSPQNPNPNPFDYCPPTHPNCELTGMTQYTTDELNEMLVLLRNIRKLLQFNVKQLKGLPWVAGIVGGSLTIWQFMAQANQESQIGGPVMGAVTAILAGSSYLSLEFAQAELGAVNNLIGFFTDAINFSYDHGQDSVTFMAAETENDPKMYVWDSNQDYFDIYDNRSTGAMGGGKFDDWYISEHFGGQKPSFYYSGNSYESVASSNYSMFWLNLFMD